MPTAKGFTGQYSDAATSGLDYYGARYYDPQLGQFTSADPAGDGLNLFVYVHGNPETLTDSTGLWTGAICISGSAGLALGGFIQGCVAIGNSADGQWSGGLTGTLGGSGWAGESAGIGISGQGSNANSVDDLGGPFTFLGFDGAFGGGLSGSGFAGKDSHGRTVLGGEGGVGIGEEGAVHGGESVTGVLDFSTIGNFFSQKASGATHWASQQLGRAKSSVGRQLGNVVHHAKQQLVRVKNWAARRLAKAEQWFDRQIGGLQDWAGQQWSRATSWVSQQWNSVASIAGQQLGRVESWFGL